MSGDMIIFDGSGKLESNQWLQLIAPVRPALQDNRYIEKIKKAMEAGLFDAAVNYAWDMVVNDLRMKVEAYGIDLFLGVEEDAKYQSNAATIPERWSNISDSKLLSGCQKLGLVSRKAFRRLQFLLSVRNYESAAHPVDEVEELDEYDAISFIR